MDQDNRFASPANLIVESYPIKDRTLHASPDVNLYFRQDRVVLAPPAGDGAAAAEVPPGRAVFQLGSACCCGVGGPDLPPTRGEGGTRGRRAGARPAGRRRSAAWPPADGRRGGAGGGPAQGGCGDGPDRVETRRAGRFGHREQLGGGASGTAAHAAPGSAAASRTAAWSSLAQGDAGQAAGGRPRGSQPARAVLARHVDAEDLPVPRRVTPARSGSARSPAAALGTSGQRIDSHNECGPASSGRCWKPSTSPYSSAAIADTCERQAHHAEGGGELLTRRIETLTGRGPPASAAGAAAVSRTTGSTRTNDICLPATCGTNPARDDAGAQQRSTATAPHSR